MDTEFPSNILCEKENEMYQFPPSASEFSSEILIKCEEQDDMYLKKEEVDAIPPLSSSELPVEVQFKSEIEDPLSLSPNHYGNNDSSTSSEITRDKLCFEPVISVKSDLEVEEKISVINKETLSQKDTPDNLVGVQAKDKPLVVSGNYEFVSRMKYIVDNPAGCSDCGEVLTQSLIKHKKICPGRKQLICTFCKKVFQERHALERHKKSHSDDYRVTCEECGRTYCNKYVLNEHMRIIHMKKKPFSCKECPQSFSKAGNLKTHMRIHTGEKPFFCKECPRSFSDASSLSRHMRNHTGEKPFSCSECQRSFIKASTLRGHMRIHTGEKPFSCNKCPKTFSHAVNLRRHLRTHT